MQEATNRDNGLHSIAMTAEEVRTQQQALVAAMSTITAFDLQPQLGGSKLHGTITSVA